MTEDEILALIERMEEQEKQRDANFCKNFTMLRKILGFTKSQMAKNCKITMYAINLIEKGIIPARLPGDILESLQTIYGISPMDMAEKDIREVLRNKIDSV